MSTRFLREIKFIFILSIPLVLTNLAQLAMSVTDMVFIGELGKTYIAAATLGINLFNTVLYFGFGIVVATAPLISQKMGEEGALHKIRSVRAITHQGLCIAILYSIPAGVFLWNAETVLLWLGQEPDLSRDAGVYLQTMLWSLPPFLLFIVMRSFCAALHKAHWTLFVTLVGIVLNGLGNWAFVSGRAGFPRWELWGSGLATAIATWMMFFAMVLMSSYHPYLKRFYILREMRWQDYKAISHFLRVGLPIGISTSFEVTIFSVAAVLIGLLSADELSAHSIALLLATISFMIPQGIGQAATIRVGYAYGARQYEGILYAGWATWFLGLIVMVIASIAFIVMPATLVSPFIDIHAAENQGVLYFAIHYLIVAALFQLVDGVQVLTSGMLRGLSKTTLPMIFAGIGYWIIGFPTGYFLSQYTYLRGLGVWIGLAVGLTIVAVCVVAYWQQLLRKFRNEWL